VAAVRAEGWYQDPFEIHAARWFSDGRPTALVRDGAREGTDPPPVDQYTGPLTDVVVAMPVDGSDLARADDPGKAPFKRSDGIKAAIYSAGYIGGN
jgi:hypothetical protein